MIRFLLGAIAALFLLRVFFQIARALSRTEAGAPPRPGGPGATRDRAARGKSRVRAATERERSRAIEVPFTEVPPEEPARRP